MPPEFPDNVDPQDINLNELALRLMETDPVFRDTLSNKLLGVFDRMTENAKSFDGSLKNGDGTLANFNINKQVQDIKNTLTIDPKIKNNIETSFKKLGGLKDIVSKFENDLSEKLKGVSRFTPTASLNRRAGRGESVFEKGITIDKFGDDALKQLKPYLGVDAEEKGTRFKGVEGRVREAGGVIGRFIRKWWPALLLGGLVFFKDNKAVRAFLEKTGLARVIDVISGRLGEIWKNNVLPTWEAHIKPFVERIKTALLDSFFPNMSDADKKIWSDRLEWMFENPALTAAAAAGLVGFVAYLLNPATIISGVAGIAGVLGPLALNPWVMGTLAAAAGLWYVGNKVKAARDKEKAELETTFADPSSTLERIESMSMKDLPEGWARGAHGIREGWRWILGADEKDAAQFIIPKAGEEIERLHGEIEDQDKLRAAIRDKIEGAMEEKIPFHEALIKYQKELADIEAEMEDAPYIETGMRERKRVKQEQIKETEAIFNRFDQYASALKYATLVKYNQTEDLPDATSEFFKILELIGSEQDFQDPGLIKYLRKQFAERFPDKPFKRPARDAADRAIEKHFGIRRTKQPRWPGDPGIANDFSVLGQGFNYIIQDGNVTAFSEQDKVIGFKEGGAIDELLRKIETGINNVNDGIQNLAGIQKQTQESIIQGSQIRAGVPTNQAPMDSGEIRDLVYNTRGRVWPKIRGEDIAIG